jgi:hypothetical protein
MLSKAKLVSCVAIISLYAAGVATLHYRSSKSIDEKADHCQPVFRSVESVASSDCGQGLDQAITYLRTSSISRDLREEQLLSVGKVKINLNKEYLTIQVKYWIGIGSVVLGIVVAVVCCYCRCCMLCTNCTCRSRRTYNDGKGCTIQTVTSDPMSTNATIASDPKDASSQSQCTTEPEVVYFNNRILPCWTNASSNDNSIMSSTLFVVD